MRICLIADLHFGVKKSDLVFQNSQLKFYTEQLVPELKEKGIETIVVLGDVFDTRQNINVQTDNVVLDLFKETFKDFKVHVIVGNHDIYYNSMTSINSLKSLNLLPNVTVYENPTEIMLGNTQVLMLPWITDYAEFDNIVTKKYKYCFTHMDIVGFDMGGSISDEGITPTKLFEKFDFVYAGHFHKRAITRQGKKAITYVGSPYQITRIDIEQPKGYTILDLDSGKQELNLNTKSMKFLKFDYPVELNEEIVKGNVIDLHIPPSLSDKTKEIFDFVERVESYSPSYKVNIFYDIDESYKSNNIEIDIANCNIEQIIKDYIEQLETSLDKKELYNSLIELYNTFSKI